MQSDVEQFQFYSMKVLLSAEEQCGLWGDHHLSFSEDSHSDFTDFHLALKLGLQDKSAKTELQLWIWDHECQL